MTVDPADAAAHLARGEHDIRFFCVGCSKAFAATPSVYPLDLCP
jgi:hypothetical protein